MMINNHNPHKGQITGRDMEISGGTKEDGVVVGNTFDKYGSGNPIVKWMMNGFHTALDSLVKRSNPQSILDVGCGEGYWVLKWREEGREAKGKDFSSHVVSLAKENAARSQMDSSIFEQGSIYELDASKDRADLLVCCEVLEHLESPEAGLEALRRVVGNNIVLSVPWEPVWRVLNMARGKYLNQFGNTPGHIQHWNRAEFITLVQKYFEIVEIKKPFPWTMVLCKPLV